MPAKETALAGLVEQIQRDAIDENVSVTSLLRRVKLAAAKLGIDDILKWVECELEGYGDNPVPEYRKVHGSIAGWNPYHGWIPVQGGEFLEQISSHDSREPITSLEELIKRDDDNTGARMDFGPRQVELLNSIMNASSPRYCLKIGRGNLVNILGSVRNNILDWAIKLEASGVKGTEFSFSQDEIRKSQQVSNTYNFNNSGSFAGNFGNGNVAGNVSVGSVDIQKTSELIRGIEQYIPDLVQSGVPESDLKQRLQLISDETKRSNPNNDIIRGALADLRNLVSGAGGNLAAAGIMEMIRNLLGS